MGFEVGCNNCAAALNAMKTTGPIAAKDAEETNAALRGATIHVRLI